MIEILCVALLAGLLILAGCKSKIISNVSFGIVTVLSYVLYGIFILVFVVGCIGVIAHWLGFI